MNAAGQTMSGWAMRLLTRAVLATLLVVLIVVFQRTGAADPAAFALTFLVFFFVYVGVEVFLVERSIEGKASQSGETS